ncbi:MAG TPA: PQQ-dependent dehydrogenase, methanol/ethanol family, partial [Aestuariivirgaceae bacterium]|nr:PQQ-dependent dehydrogenase, methanol/ethanol family [Aestuariivirgaceae bacterium]
MARLLFPILFLLIAARIASAQAPAIAPPPAAAPPEDGQWALPAKDYASTRFSGLDEINSSNVKSLQVAFTFSTGV